MNLFLKRNVILHTGQKSDFKIECDALTDDDFATLAYLISKKFKFHAVSGVPSGGLQLAEALEQYADKDESLPVLVVDDVLTSGTSITEHREKICCFWHNVPIIGVVIFARGKCPEWVTPIFQMML